MIARRGTPLAEIDRQASELDMPYAVITADCTDPFEYDDAVSVTRLNYHEELYRVQVFSVDTSPLYEDESVMKRVLAQTESKYRTHKNGATTYEPMLSEALVRKFEFSSGNTRRALCVSFVIGAAQAPTDIEVGFGRVEVAKNYSYKRFGEKCRYSDNFEKYGRAAALILAHLHAKDTSEEELYNGLIHVPSGYTFRRGAHINAAFMIGANHLFGRVMRDEGHLAVFKVHDTSDDRLYEIIDDNVAVYSAAPGPHEGVGVDVYAKVTSPLRRLEDAINIGMAAIRSSGRSLSTRDLKIVNQGIKRLNQRVVADIFHGRLHRAAKESLEDIA